MKKLTALLLLAIPLAESQET